MKILQWIIFLSLISFGLKGCLDGGVISPILLAIMAMIAYPAIWEAKAPELTDEEFLLQKKKMRIIAIVLLAVVYWRYPTADKKKDNYASSINKSDTLVKSSGDSTANMDKVEVKEESTVGKYSTDSVVKWSKKANKLYSSKDNKAAIEVLSNGLQKMRSDTLLMQRAKYYIEIGDNENAKMDLYKVRNVNKEYHKLYELARGNSPQEETVTENTVTTNTVTTKPTRKKIAGHCTLCNDGTYSKTCATGRGACSRHGGVKQYNAPIYE